MIPSNTQMLFFGPVQNPANSWKPSVRTSDLYRKQASTRSCDVIPSAAGSLARFRFFVILMIDWRYTNAAKHPTVKNRPGNPAP